MHCLPVLLALTAILLPGLFGGCIPLPTAKTDNPVFTPAEGTFSVGVEVTIQSSTDGAAIRYTTDGSTPSSSGGTVYQDKLTLTETTTIKAIAYKDGLDPSDVVIATYLKTPPAATVTITNPSASGSLVEDAAGTLSVACTVTASGTDVQSVTADLSQVGGSQAQTLTPSGDQYTWSDSLTPTSHGDRTITFTAAGTAGGTATATATITVAPPPGAPTITDPAVAGTLTINKSGSVTVSCTATLAGNTVQSVTADLSSIGGEPSQTLTASGDTWSWTGSVTPPTGGTQTITFTATGDSHSSHSTATVSVTTSQPGALAGAWAGNVNYEETARWGSWVFPSTTAVVASSVVFSAQYQPDSLPVSVGSANTEVQVPTATLMAVNDQVAADVQEPRSGKTYHVTAAVTSITRSATAFAIGMDLTLAQGTSTPWHGPYTWTGTLGADDKLTWVSTTKWDLGSGITDDVTSSGTLTRQ